VNFEEGTWAAWLYDLLQPHVTRVVVSDPRKNALLKDGNKNDRIDARKLAELLYLNKFNSVYHGEHGLESLFLTGFISGDGFRLFRRSGSRVSIHNPVTAESVLGAPPVSRETLGPLG
jgi:transposase